MNYTHVEAPQAENDNNDDYKQFKSQKLDRNLY